MTKNLKILGSENCAKCEVLKENIERVIKEKNFDVNIEKVNDIEKIIEYGVMSLPAIVINDKVVSYGKTLTDKEINDLLLTL